MVLLVKPSVLCSYSNIYPMEIIRVLFTIDIDAHTIFHKNKGICTH